MMFSAQETKIIVELEEFKKCFVLRENGESVALNSLWVEHPAIFVFLRHFGCDACRRHAVDVWGNRQKYEEKGAHIHFIGNGSPAVLAEFKSKHKLEGASFFTDPTLRSFQAAGFRRGFWIDPGDMHTRAEFLYKALRFAAKQENAGSGNVWQLGGVLVIRPGDQVSYQFTSLTMGHFPPASDIPVISGARKRALS